MFKKFIFLYILYQVQKERIGEILQNVKKQGVNIALNKLLAGSMKLPMNFFKNK